MYIVFVNPNYKLKKYYILKKTNVKNIKSNIFL